MIKLPHLTAVVLLLLAGCEPSSAAETSASYARKGRVIFSAFACSHYAGMMDREEPTNGEPNKEAERLFILGYDEGKIFFDAARGGKIEQKDISSTVPMIVTMNAQGPSVDFILGRIYSASVDEAEKNIHADITNGDIEGWKQLRTMKARSSYQDNNCELLGR